MAKRLKSNELVSNRSRAALYPWSDWTDGDWWELDEGVDFRCRPASFRVAAYKWAARNGYQVETQLPEWGGCVRLRFQPRTEFIYDGVYEPAEVRGYGDTSRTQYEIIGPPETPERVARERAKRALGPDDPIGIPSTVEIADEEAWIVRYRAGDPSAHAEAKAEGLNEYAYE